MKNVFFSVLVDLKGTFTMPAKHIKLAGPQQDLHKKSFLQPYLQELLLLKFKIFSYSIAQYEIFSEVLLSLYCKWCNAIFVSVCQISTIPRPGFQCSLNLIQFASTVNSCLHSKIISNNLICIHYKLFVQICTYTPLPSACPPKT